jgi:hypothetical protein
VSIFFGTPFLGAFNICSSLEASDEAPPTDSQANCAPVTKRMISQVDERHNYNGNSTCLLTPAVYFHFHVPRQMNCSDAQNAHGSDLLCVVLPI